MKNIASLVLILFLSGCNDFSIKNLTEDRDNTNFIKVNVVIETPNGQVSGFSVNAYNIKCRRGILGKTCAIYQSSEAVKIDLPNGRTVYALLSRKGEKEWLITAPERVMERDPNNIERRYFKSDMLPDFVYFEDNKIPSSVKFINKEGYFFDGYKVKSVSIEPFFGPRTNKLYGDLKWVYGLVGSLSGKPMRDMLSEIDADRLNRSDFIKDDIYGKFP